MKKIFLVVLLVFLTAPLVTSAAITNIWEGTGGGTANTTCNIWPYHCTICDGAIIIINIIEFLLALGVVIAVLMTLYGGFRLITSGGSQTQVSQGKSIITNAIVGLVIISCSWLIVATIFKVLTTKTDWNVLNIIGCQSGNLNATQAQPIKQPANQGQIGTVTKLTAPKTTPQQKAINMQRTEGDVVAEIAECGDIRLDSIQQNFFSKLIPFTKASTFGEDVIAAALQFKGKLKYSNDAVARRDPAGKSSQCQNLIKGTPYTGCADCSGFIFKMYGCVAGENVSLYMDKVVYVNSQIMSDVELPSGLERYFFIPFKKGETKKEKKTREEQYEFIIGLVKPGDILGFDVNCHKKWNSNAKFGHVMLFEKYTNINYKTGEADVQIIDQGKDGGAFQRIMDEDNLIPLTDCGYVIHITNQEN